MQDADAGKDHLVSVALREFATVPTDADFGVWGSGLNSGRLGNGLMLSVDRPVEMLFAKRVLDVAYAAGLDLFAKRVAHGRRNDRYLSSRRSERYRLASSNGPAADDQTTLRP